MEVSTYECVLQLPPGQPWPLYCLLTSLGDGESIHGLSAGSPETLELNEALDLPLSRIGEQAGPGPAQLKRTGC